jgi:hypothetical protein
MDVAEAVQESAMEGDWVTSHDRTNAFSYVWLNE